ncbi:hypothetical protein M3Y98_00872700 [Aphelenchoides besseyi]|nr:hypothetical protein M3Y98_00872700 [Aphelenchoides besseyi]KAI6211300.1 hypothetical protein M3Y96_00419000 [Aphelenchoides besseyi]
MVVFFFLFLFVHLSSEASICTDDNTQFSVDQVSFGEYSTARYHKVGVHVENPIDNFFYFPKPVFDTLIDKLNARKVWINCDPVSISIYPNLTFTYNGNELIVPPQDYIQTEYLVGGQCPVYLAAMIFEPVDYRVPSRYQHTVCGAT